MKSKEEEIIEEDPDINLLLLEIKYKLGIIEEKIKNHEKLIYIILGSILTLIIKVFLL